MGFKLNRYQKDAVTHKDGPCLVTSCPGSGKTRVLTERASYLISQGIKQKNILCLTFTNKASNEMKERICKRLGVEKLDFFVGTFHSLCARMMRKLSPRHGYKANFSILDEKDQIDLIMQMARKLGYDNIEKGDAYKIASHVNYYRDQMEDFEWVTDSLKTAPMIEIAEAYLDHCRTNSLLDFSGLIYEVIQILEDDDDVRRKIQNTFKYIMVDETQDTNIAQFHLINLLGGKWRNIMLIADTDQSIYGWRGARYQNIQQFINDYEDCRVISLSKNYRSTPQIVSSASKLIKHNTSHMGTIFETDNKDGEKVRCYAFKDQLSEADWVGSTIKKFMEEGGWDPQDMAVLYRVNKMSEPVEQSMVNHGIPYEVIGAWNFYDRKEVRDCLAMLKLLSNPHDGIAFHRICSFVKGMGNTTIGKIENLAQEKNISIPKACKEISREVKSVNITRACDKISNIYNKQWDYTNPAGCLKELVSKLNYNDHILNKFGNSANERNDNITQLIDSAGECNGQEDGVSKYLQQISLITNTDKETDGNKVSLMSLHAAKGLEFPIVFLIGFENDILPHKNALADDPYGGLEEERRLAYVGMTRAKKVLFTTWCKNRRRFGKYGNMTFNKCKPSRFLLESELIKEEDIYD